MKCNDSDNKPIYSVLAPLYDHIMRDVDYEAWADYIDDLIQLHSPYSEQLLELACGTGSVSLSLGELGYYRILATDQSRQMIQVARKKSKETDSRVQFRPMNFLDIQLKQTFDVVFMIFDSLNYLHTEREILQLHNEVKNVLRPGGFFIFDYTTPCHSREAIHYLDGEEGVVGNRFRYQQSSQYNEESHIHTNRFRIELLENDDQNGQQVLFEEHRQKAWPYQAMNSILDKTDFHILNRYDGFELVPAHEKSHRITIVSQCLKTV